MPNGQRYGLKLAAKIPPSRIESHIINSVHNFTNFYIS